MGRHKTSNLGTQEYQYCIAWFFYVATLHLLRYEPLFGHTVVVAVAV